VLTKGVKGRLAGGVQEQVEIGPITGAGQWRPYHAWGKGVVANLADLQMDFPGRQGIRKLCRSSVAQCREFKLTHAIVFIDGSKFKGEQ